MGNTELRQPSWDFEGNFRESLRIKKMTGLLNQNPSESPDFLLSE